MKKLFTLLLCLSMLLLPGCQLQELSQLEPVVPPTGSEEDYRKWNNFIWDSKWGKECSVEIQRTHEDGSTEKITVTYDKEKYTITDDANTRTYTYLRSFSHVEKTDSGYLYGDYFFLTDDPGLTFEKYQKAQSTSLKDHMELLLPTELVLGKTGVTDEVECYGNAPQRMETVFNALAHETKCYWGENSFFTTEYVPVSHINTDFEDRESYTLNRYDYNGRLLCSVEIPDWRTTAIVECSDGSFYVALEDYTNTGEAEVLAFSATGKLRWHYEYSQDKDVSIYYLFEMGDAIYGFGGLNTDTAAPMDDLYFVKFNKDGTLLKEVIAGGSDTERLHHVIFSSAGFIVTGETYSTDGDFPLSTGKQETGFRVEVNSELELSNVKSYPESEYIFTHYGFHDGLPVYDKATVLDPSEADRLPENAFAYAIFPKGNGYVILRRIVIEEYAFYSPMFSGMVYYRQLIATYYNAFGKPVWQTVSEPYLA